MSKAKMSRRTRTLLLSGAAVVVLGGVLAVLLLVPGGEGLDTSSQASSDPTISLLDKTTDADGETVEQPVKDLSVKLESEEFAFVDKDGELAVEAYQDLPINSYAVETLTDAVSSITASQKVGAVDNPADFGFDSPLATVSATYHDDSAYSFELGSETPLKDGYYFREAGTDDIYIVSTSLGTTVTTPSPGYIGLTLMAAPSVDSDDENGQAVLRDMVLSGSVRETPMAFQMTTTEDQDTSFSFYTYKFTSPYLRGMDSNAASSFMTYTSLSASGVAKAYPTEEDLAKYGLDEPYSVAKLNLAVSTTVDDPDASTVSTESGTETPQKTSYYNVTPYTITVGNQDEDGNYYVMVNDVPVVYIVSASSIELWVDVQYDDLADKLLFLQDITGVESVSLTLDGEETLFQLTHYPEKEESDEMLVVTADGKTYDTADFRTLYQLMMGISRNSAADSVPEGEPILVLKVTPSNKEDVPIVASFYEDTPSLSVCVLDTGESFRVKASDISWLRTQFERYLNGEEVRESV